MKTRRSRRLKTPAAPASSKKRKISPAKCNASKSVSIVTNTPSVTSRKERGNKRKKNSRGHTGRSSDVVEDDDVDDDDDDVYENDVSHVRHVDNEDDVSGRTDDVDVTEEGTRAPASSSLCHKCNAFVRDLHPEQHKCKRKFFEQVGCFVCTATIARECYPLHCSTKHPHVAMTKVNGKPALRCNLCHTTKVTSAQRHLREHLCRQVAGGACALCGKTTAEIVEEANALGLEFDEEDEAQVEDCVASHMGEHVLDLKTRHSYCSRAVDWVLFGKINEKKNAAKADDPVDTCGVRGNFADYMTLGDSDVINASSDDVDLDFSDVMLSQTAETVHVDDYMFEVEVTSDEHVPHTSWLDLSDDDDNYDVGDDVESSLSIEQSSQSPRTLSKRDDVTFDDVIVTEKPLRSNAGEFSTLDLSVLRQGAAPALASRKLNVAKKSTTKPAQSLMKRKQREKERASPPKKIKHHDGLIVVEPDGSDFNIDVSSNAGLPKPTIEIENGGVVNTQLNAAAGEWNDTLFVCGDCGANFNTVDKLMQHSEIHSLGTNYNDVTQGNDATQGHHHDVTQGNDVTRHKHVTATDHENVQPLDTNIVVKVKQEKQDEIKPGCQWADGVKPVRYTENLTALPPPRDRSGQIDVRLANQRADWDSKRKFPCDYCGKRFVTPSSVRRHVNVLHLGITQFKCRICGRPTPSASELARHEITHKADEWAARGVAPPELTGDSRHANEYRRKLKRDITRYGLVPDGDSHVPSAEGEKGMDTTNKKQRATPNILKNSKKKSDAPSSTVSSANQVTVVTGTFQKQGVNNIPVAVSMATGHSMGQQLGQPIQQMGMLVSKTPATHSQPQMQQNAPVTMGTQQQLLPVTMGTRQNNLPATMGTQQQLPVTMETQQQHLPVSIAIQQPVISNTVAQLNVSHPQLHAHLTQQQVTKQPTQQPATMLTQTFMGPVPFPQTQPMFTGLRNLGDSTVQFNYLDYGNPQMYVTPAAAAQQPHGRVIPTSSSNLGNGNIQTGPFSGDIVLLPPMGGYNHNLTAVTLGPQPSNNVTQFVTSAQPTSGLTSNVAPASDNVTQLVTSGIASNVAPASNDATVHATNAETDTGNQEMRLNGLPPAYGDTPERNVTKDMAREEDSDFLKMLMS